MARKNKGGPWSSGEEGDACERGKEEKSRISSFCYAPLSFALSSFLDRSHHAQQFALCYNFTIDYSSITV